MNASIGGSNDTIRRATFPCMKGSDTMGLKPTLNGRFSREMNQYKVYPPVVGFVKDAIKAETSKGALPNPMISAYAAVTKTVPFRV